ncbi:MAG TPA: helix-turn-helix transcriptional regulator [Burkholderiaceae bacterium]|jgi:DNA-binding CsgD family transcriptional regulator|nr:helix-turn-helix transcriptional regulator [Burkholderiaceae bacterium]
MSADPCEISDEQGQAFWRAAEAARDVHDRYQFFVWLRLHLNRFMPHELALCLFRAEQETRVEPFNSVPISTSLLDALSAGRSRWWRDLEEAWVRGGRQAVVVPIRPDSAARSAATPTAANEANPDPMREVDALHAAGFRALLVHGFDAQSGLRPETLFAFALNGPEALEARHARLVTHLNLCLPVLHCTAVRTLAARAGESAFKGDPREPAPEARPKDPRGVALTRRQIEIIAAVRDAKRNAEIGTLLGISAATVKNHLHTIMRKLHATNRAQAVAEAMSRRLIS